MAHSKFDNLDGWLRSGPTRAAFLRSLAWRVSGVVFGRSQAWLRKDPKHVAGYFYLARARRDTHANVAALDALDEASLSTGIAMFGMGCGTERVERALSVVEMAGCGADFAPRENLPTVAELAAEWAAWFDAHYLYKPREMAAQRVALSMVARMERKVLDEAASVPIPSKGTSARL